MSAWFQGSSELDCSIERVREVLDNPGEYFAAVVSRMPGLTDVQLVKQQDDAVTIKTSEGLMKRTGIVRRIEADHVEVEYDENYQAGSKVTTDSHFVEEFVAGNSRVTYRLTISDVGAPGLLGSLYRRFGSKKMGAAFLSATEACLQRPAE